jgi:hypothetical protein
MSQYQPPLPQNNLILEELDTTKLRLEIIDAKLDKLLKFDKWTMIFASVFIFSVFALPIIQGFIKVLKG